MTPQPRESLPGRRDGDEATSPARRIPGTSLQQIPARRAVLARVARAERVRVVNTHGQQVADTSA